jgi:hypothetical protein
MLHPVGRPPLANLECLYLKRCVYIDAPYMHPRNALAVPFEKGKGGLDDCRPLGWHYFPVRQLLMTTMSYSLIIVKLHNPRSPWTKDPERVIRAVNFVEGRNEHRRRESYQKCQWICATRRDSMSELCVEVVQKVPLVWYAMRIWQSISSLEFPVPVEVPKRLLERAMYGLEDEPGVSRRTHQVRPGETVSLYTREPVMHLEPVMKVKVQSLK